MLSKETSYSLGVVEYFQLKILTKHDFKVSRGCHLGKTFFP